MIMLGNMTVAEIETRVGVTLPKELVEYMSTRHNQSAQSFPKGTWHCFELPFTLVCGDRETATEIHRHLAPLGGSFKCMLNISISR